MQTHELKTNKKKVSPKRVGRGGRRGKTSGKGHKGQKARSGGGGSPRPYIREDIKRIPKRRGYGKNRARTVHSSRKPTAPIKLSDIGTFEGKIVSPKSLVDAGIVEKYKGKLPSIKIVGTGEAPSGITVRGILVSDGAREKIEKAGGSVQ